MRQRDLGDILGGLLMIVIGLFAVWYAQRYAFGSPRQMGPGFFPVVLGWVLAGLGVLILLPALRRAGEPVKFELKPLIVIVSAVAIFGFTLRPLGLVLATMLTVALAAAADRNFSPLGRVVLPVVLAAMIWLVFRVGLGMNLPVWPRGF